MTLQNARTYLFIWGLWSGALLGAAYALLILLLQTLDARLLIAAIATGAYLGAPIGMTAGLLGGMLLDWLVAAGHGLPLSDLGLQRLQQQALHWIPIVGAGWVLIGSALFLRSLNPLLFVLPVASSMMVMRHAVCRYIETLPTEFKFKLQHKAKPPVSRGGLAHESL